MTKNILNLQEKIKIIVTRSPFNSGLLTNNFSKYVYYPKTDFRFEYFSGKNFELKKKNFRVTEK